MQVSYKNFSPKENQKEYIYDTLDRIREFAPPEASVNGIFKQKRKGFEGRLSIVFRSKVVSAKARAEDLVSVISQLHSKIRRQIVDWKKRRSPKTRHKRRLELVPDFQD